ncbi:hypothetical protein NQ317_008226 [Molorchus minor]|uniref:TRAFD1/XAF1 zinc finger domain-containing protein n=1 Tax=Molorchus minor TaxID=1323400 RepID=A0ABQ9JWZ5_9CUCU|nr:hypothetical protein NQ317_008226 [Molorchus minor]
MLCTPCTAPGTLPCAESAKRQYQKPSSMNTARPANQRSRKNPCHYLLARKTIEDKKIEARKDRYMQKYDRLGIACEIPPSSYGRQSSYERTDIGSSYKLPTSYSTSSIRQNGVSSVLKEIKDSSTSKKEEQLGATSSIQEKKTEPKPSGLLACKYCDLELPKLDLEEHENYCGSRTDKCLECGELLKDEPGPRASWDSSTQRTTMTETTTRRRPQPFRSFVDFDYDPMPYLPSSYQAPGGGAKKKEGESYKEISRRLDCKTEYIRNLLHDSAGITVPLRRSGTAPRNHFNHNKGPAPQPPAYRRRNPPTELIIPCEFCGVPIPHEELIQHETGCRPDLARFNPRMKVTRTRRLFYSSSTQLPRSGIAL